MDLRNSVFWDFRFFINRERRCPGFRELLRPRLSRETGFPGAGLIIMSIGNIF